MLSKSNIWNFEALEFYDLKLRSSGIVKAIVATKDISHYCIYCNICISINQIQAVILNFVSFIDTFMRAEKFDAIGMEMFIKINASLEDKGF